jgi:CPA1 family monovalent cation:H+ antiporter
VEVGADMRESYRTTRATESRESTRDITVIMEYEAGLILLFAVATAVALVARRVEVPYTVALVLAGLVLGNTHAFAVPHLNKAILYGVILPRLLLEAAFHLDFDKFLKNRLAINALAVPGVVAAIAVTALILTPVVAGLHFVDGFTCRA